MTRCGISYYAIMTRDMRNRFALELKRHRPNKASHRIALHCIALHCIASHRIAGNEDRFVMSQSCSYVLPRESLGVDCLDTEVFAARIVDPRPKDGIKFDTSE